MDPGFRRDDPGDDETMPKQKAGVAAGFFLRIL
jgi:hypothetical protein